MRTTLRIPDPLFREAKAQAARTGRTLGSLLEDALRAYLGRIEAPRPKRKVRLTTYGKGGVRPGVNLDNSAELLDIMEGRLGPP